MNHEERLVADFHGTGLTVGPHPMAYRRAWLNAMGIRRAIELRDIPNGKRLRIGGCVITRQRPGTAKGFVFLSLEDETGVANAIVTPDLFHQQPPAAGQRALPRHRRHPAESGQRDFRESRACTARSSSPARKLSRTTSTSESQIEYPVHRDGSAPAAAKSPRCAPALRLFVRPSDLSVMRVAMHHKISSMPVHNFRQPRRAHEKEIFPELPLALFRRSANNATRLLSSWRVVATSPAPTSSPHRPQRAQNP